MSEEDIMWQSSKLEAFYWMGVGGLLFLIGMALIPYEMKWAGIAYLTLFALMPVGAMMGELYLVVKGVNRRE